ncbi:MAG: 16S rRNA (cytosine(1402)-N(4))-methyltransferase RsmH [Candidatus Omnitrophota bacterium]
MKYHIPVMFNEILEYLNLGPGKTIVDATIGTGGHSMAILEHISPKGRLIAIDRDSESLAVSRERLHQLCGNCEFMHENFAKLDSVLESLKIEKVDGVIFDLGISSYQLDDPRRGFSFRYDGPLDMRLDRNSYISAYDLVNNLNEEEISTLLRNFGQERWHNRIAHLLVEERERHPIATTAQLANIVIRAIPPRFRHRYYRIHPATRTFQAVRIAVNRELENLEIAINKAITVLEKKGRICVISFHSLEDRIVKHTFRRAASEGLIKIITAKPLTPSESEIQSNPSSRSSKLRVAERL